MSARLTPGSVFAGDFRVVRALGRGGMGQVFVAEQISTGRQRALKVMTGDLGERAEARRRFVQEAKIGAAIDSDHVVEVVAAGVDEPSGTLWLAMELLEGEDLHARRVRVCTLAPREVASLFEQLAHALDRAHARGVVHRDLKPANVFLARSKRSVAGEDAKILDFGIAKLVDEARTSATGAIGTPLWMSPEQSQPGAHITPAADIWPLGLIAFRALAGKPFWLSAHGTNVSPLTLMREILIDAVPTASDRARELGAKAPPAGFDAWFARCVARDPGERFRSAGAAYAALADVLAASAARTAPSPTIIGAGPTRVDTEVSYTATATARPPPLTAIDARPLKRGPPWPWVVGAAGLLAGIVMLIAIASSSASAPPPAEDSADAARPVASARAPRIPSAPPSAAPTAKRVPTSAPKPDLPPPGCVDCSVRGTVSDALQRSFKPMIGSLHACHVGATGRAPAAGGRVTLVALIGTNGETCSVEVQEDTLGDPGVTSCMVERLKAETWIPPSGGCASVVFPLALAPR